MHPLLFVQESNFPYTGIDMFVHLPPPDIAVLIGIVFVVLAAVVAVAALYGRVSYTKYIEEELKTLAPYAPHVIRSLAGVALVINALQQTVFVPEVPLEKADAIAAIFIAVQFITGIALALGFAAHAFGIVLILLFAAALVVLPWMNVLYALSFLGIGLYLAAVGSDISLEKCLKKRLQKTHVSKISIVRIALGMELIAAGIIESIVRNQETLAAVKAYNLNMISHMNVWMTDERFVYFVGLLQIGFGLLLVLRWAPRLTAFLLFLACIELRVFFGPATVLFDSIAFLGIIFAILVAPPFSQEEAREIDLKN